MKETKTRKPTKLTIMIGLNIYKAPPLLLEQVDNICRLLWQGKQEYELVATSISDKDLRRTMLSLAQESNQYACELSSQIQTLGGNPVIQKPGNTDPEDEIKNLHGENEIVVFCQKNERQMIIAYREILNDSFLYEELRKMIRYQLNQMLCAFMRVKQIGCLKFH